MEHIEDEENLLCTTFLQQSVTELTDMLKREHEAAEKYHICLKDFNIPENREVRDHCHYIDLYQVAANRNCNLKYGIPDYISFHNLSGYDFTT